MFTFDVVITFEITAFQDNYMDKITHFCLPTYNRPGLELENVQYFHLDFYI